MSKARAFIPCSPPPDHGLDALALARVAVAENPANAPPAHALDVLRMTAILAPGEDPIPQFIAVMTSKYWGPKTRTLGVSFLDQTGPTTRNLILGHMNAWNQWCGISFAESASGEIRVSRGAGGYWSYLGTDILSIPAGKPTMNLQGFTEKTSDAEYRRVVRHEIAHSLGCPHEHMRRQIVARIDPAKAVAYFKRTQGWSEEMTVSNVLTPLDESSLMGTPTAEADSVMAYQLPGSITRDGQPVVGGTDITPSDAAFMAKLYPRADAVAPPSPPVRPSPPAGPEIMPVGVGVALASDWLRMLGHTITPPAKGEAAWTVIQAEVARVVESLRAQGYTVSR